MLPEVERYQPTEDGESPLAAIDAWVNVLCPKCGGAAKRETDVMPNWAGSSWYYLRYTDPYNADALASAKALNHWLPVDWYNGGMEHTTLHLLYSRFWHKFLNDIGAAPGIEPYAKRTSQGLVLASDGEKMSKSRGNSVNPDEIVERLGADTLRLYEMFMGPFDQSVVWSTDNMVGSRRFLERAFSLTARAVEMPLSQPLESLLHQTIKKVGEDIEQMKYNTAVSQLMILLNGMDALHDVPQRALRQFVQLLAPFAPHLASEIWETLGEQGSVQTAGWPKYDKALCVPSTTKIAVQVNGKVRAVIESVADAREEEIKRLAEKLPTVEKWLEGKKIAATFYVPGRLINFVTNA